MTGDWKALRQRLDEATDRWKRSDDPEAKVMHGADVRELERLVEIAADQDPDAPIEPSRHL